MSKKKTILLVIGIVLIVGLLATGLIFTAKKAAGDMVSQAHVTRARSDLRRLELALTAYEQFNQFVPPTQEQGLQALVKKPASEPVPKRWLQMLDSEENLIDPWGNPYQYRVPTTKSGKKYDIWSIGPDGKESEDDIGNW